MKFFKTSIMTLGLVLGITTAAVAGDGSFNCTNYLQNGVNYTLYPTNASGIGTGSGVDIRDYKSVGFYISGDLQNSASAPIGISLVRADKVTTGGVTNWETTAVYKFLITAPATTNHFDWVTNLPEDFAGCAYKIGISQLTNNFTSGNFLTNVDVGVIKKITPTKY